MVDLVEKRTLHLSSKIAHQTVDGILRRVIKFFTSSTSAMIGLHTIGLLLLGIAGQDAQNVNLAPVVMTYTVQ